MVNKRVTDKLDEAEIRKALYAAGWADWYHPDYWVHPQVVKDPTRQDYTNYGVSLAEAWRLHVAGHPWGER